jgi:hypothetical protein
VSLENTNRNLEEQRAGNEVFVNNHRELINVYNHLEAMKFGIKELWFLRGTVMEIARENDISPDQSYYDIECFLLSRLVSISAYITCSIVSQFEYLKSNNGDGFATLGSAYKGEESVPHEVKKELTKPIENKLEVKDRLTGALSSVLPADE